MLNFIVTLAVMIAVCTPIIMALCSMDKMEPWDGKKKD